MPDLTTVNISMPASLKKILDREVRLGRYSSTSELIRDMIRQREKDREYLEELIQEGLDSGPGIPWNKARSKELLEHAKKIATLRRQFLEGQRAKATNPKSSVTVRSA